MDERVGERAGEAEGRAGSLAAAIRAARIEGAERTQAHGDLRDAEIARLELLRELLEPVLSQVPADVDLFDVGVVPGEHPRLFIDMVAFVEMGRDRRTYRLIQDRRHGRAVLSEAEGVTASVAAVTAYIARRLVEREQVLASLGREDAPGEAAELRDAPARARARARAVPRAGRVLRLALDVLGVAMLGALAWLGVLYAQGRLPHW